MDIENKSILVTGGSGFIGSYLVKELIKRKASVSVLYNKSIERLNDIKDKIILIKGDIRNFDVKNKFDLVIHLAAVVNPGGPENPEYVKDINVNGTLHTLEFCKKNNIKKFYFLSSIAVYGKVDKLPMSEEDNLNPVDYYSKTKLEAEKLVLKYCKENGIDVCAIRSANAYGYGQDNRRLVPTLINQFLTKDEIMLRNIDSRRDFIYVDDLAEGIILLIKNNCTGIYNIGSGEDYQIKDIYNMISKLLKKTPTLDIQKGGEHPVKRAYLNIEKIKKIGWIPRTSLEEGLRKTLKLYKSHILTD